MVMRPAIRRILDIGCVKFARIQASQNGFGIIAQRHAQMIDEVQRAIGAHDRMEAELSKGGATLHQRSAAVVADAAYHRRAETG